MATGPAGKELCHRGLEVRKPRIRPQGLAATNLASPSAESTSTSRVSGSTSPAGCELLYAKLDRETHAHESNMLVV